MASSFQFTVADNDESPNIYANIVRVASTPWEFLLQFACASIPADEHKIKESIAASPDNSAHFYAPSIANVRIPPRTAKMLADMLYRQYNEYVHNIENANIRAHGSDVLRNDDSAV